VSGLERASLASAALTMPAWPAALCATSASETHRNYVLYNKCRVSKY